MTTNSRRRTALLGAAVSTAVLTLGTASARQPASPPPALKTMSQSLGLVVFPAKEQSAAVQQQAGETRRRPRRPGLCESSFLWHRLAVSS